MQDLDALIAECLGHVSDLHALEAKVQKAEQRLQATQEFEMPNDHEQI